MSHTGLKTTTVYKALQELGDGKLYSLYARGKYQTEYAPGELVKRERIFVFLQQWRAEQVLDIDMNMQVWECETESDPVSAPDYIPDYDHTDDNDAWGGVSPEDAERYIAAFWESPYDRGDGPLILLHPHVGSYLVNDVTLIRRIS